jgi:hypothetical protein
MKIIFNVIVCATLLWYLCGCALHSRVDATLAEWNNEGTRIVKKIKRGARVRVPSVPLDDFKVVVRPTGLMQNRGLYVGTEFTF